MGDNENWFYVGKERLKEIVNYIKEQFDKRQRAIDTINAELGGCYLTYENGKFYIHHGDDVKLLGSEGTATQDRVLEGATFDSLEYDGTVEGTMPNNGSWSATQVVAIKGAKEVLIPEGYHDGTGKVTVPALGPIDFGVYIWNIVRANNTSYALGANGPCVQNGNYFTRNGSSAQWTYTGPSGVTFCLYAVACSTYNSSSAVAANCYTQIRVNGTAVVTANTSGANAQATNSVNRALNYGDVITMYRYTKSVGSYTFSTIAVWRA